VKHIYCLYNIGNMDKVHLVLICKYSSVFLPKFRDCGFKEVSVIYSVIEIILTVLLRS
jgi:hypothetical protein